MRLSRWRLWPVLPVLLLGWFFAVRHPRTHEVLAEPERPPAPAVLPLPSPPAGALALSNEPLALGPPLELSASALPWELEVSALLSGAGDNRTTAATLLAVLPTLPEEAYASVAEAATRHTADCDYDAVLLPRLLDVSTHGAIEAVLYQDVITRPSKISLPALQALAQDRTHPYAASAQDALQVLQRPGR